MSEDESFGAKPLAGIRIQIGRRVADRLDRLVDQHMKKDRQRDPDTALTTRRAWRDSLIQAAIDLYCETYEAGESVSREEGEAERNH